MTRWNSGQVLCILNTDTSDFESQVKGVANIDGQRITGFTTSKQGLIESFTMTRYPRKKYGVLPVEHCAAKAELLATRLGTLVVADTQRERFRIVLGLKEGYDIGAPERSIDEVSQELPEDCNVSRADVFALRPNNQDYSLYTEPVAIIRCDLGSLRRVYNLAEDTMQERFSVEDFDNMRSFMVETAHCTESDL